MLVHMFALTSLCSALLCTEQVLLLWADVVYLLLVVFPFPIYEKT